MRTIVYVDGFNLYYGAVKNTPHKWLDLLALFRSVLGPAHDIVALKYFTARVSATPADPSKPQRQDVYLRALRTFPEISIHFGHFLTHQVRAPLANPTPRARDAVILKTEEKGSDVNLAVHLLNDAWHRRYDSALVVSNDGDLAEAIRLTKLESSKPVGIAVPSATRPAHGLRREVDFVRRVRRRALASSQLPTPIPGTTITKPPTW